jgi:hypothetical protein
MSSTMTKQDLIDLEAQAKEIARYRIEVMADANVTDETREGMKKQQDDLEQQARIERRARRKAAITKVADYLYGTQSGYGYDDALIIALGREAKANNYDSDLDTSRAASPRWFWNDVADILRVRAELTTICKMDNRIDRHLVRQYVYRYLVAVDGVRSVNVISNELGLPRQWVMQAIRDLEDRNEAEADRYSRKGRSYRVITPEEAARRQAKEDAREASQLAMQDTLVELLGEEEAAEIDVDMSWEKVALTFEQIHKLAARLEVAEAARDAAKPINIYSVRTVADGYRVERKRLHANGNNYLGTGAVETTRYLGVAEEIVIRLTEQCSNLRHTTTMRNVEKQVIAEVIAEAADVVFEDAGEGYEGLVRVVAVSEAGRSWMALATGRKDATDYIIAPDSDGPDSVVASVLNNGLRLHRNETRS